tara:strand:+ start:2140 stop:2313 length:174 start_codon:yes stop_codon:yes gene_type:complete
MRVLILAAVLLLNGCAGMGFHKRATLMPDEFSISFDSNPQDDGNIDEITGGFKWQLN